MHVALELLLEAHVALLGGELDDVGKGREHHVGLRRGRGLGLLAHGDRRALGPCNRAERGAPPAEATWAEAPPPPEPPEGRRGAAPALTAPEPSASMRSASSGVGRSAA